MTEDLSVSVDPRQIGLLIEEGISHVKVINPARGARFETVARVTQPDAGGLRILARFLWLTSGGRSPHPGELSSQFR